ncbi:MAG: cell division protein FtsZ [Candidatus Syntropharchaeia archaeon]
MESIVENAIMYSGKENQTEYSEELFKPQIVVIGVGGAGNNTIKRLSMIGIEGAETIAINTDKQHLDMIQANKKILIGKSLTRGLGAGGCPEIGRKAADMAKGMLQELLEGKDLVFITAGMGGGTGTGAAPVIADIAKSQGAIVIGMVSSPFRVERARLLKAEEGLDELRKACDTVIVLDNNRLLKYVPNLPIGQAFSVMDQLIAETIKGISETITQPSLINLDYADIKTVMGAGGVAAMFVGESKAQDKASNVVRTALSHPLLDVNCRGARGALVHITGGPDLTLEEADRIVEEMTYELDPGANVIWGARIDKSCEAMVKVMAIITGVECPQILGPDGGKERNNIRSRRVETLTSIDQIH